MCSGNPQHLRPPTPRAAVMHMGCSPTETKPPRQGPSKPPSALEHPSPEFQPREGHGWLMQQLLPPEPSMVPWALARTGHPTGVRHPHTPPHKPRALVLSLGPETKSQTPVGSQKHKSHLHPTAHSPHSIPHRKGHGGGGQENPHRHASPAPCPARGAPQKPLPQTPAPQPSFLGQPAGLPGCPPPPGRDISWGALTNMARLKRIIMTLIKVKHPIFAPGESRKVIRGTPHLGTTPALLRAGLSPRPPPTPLHSTRVWGLPTGSTPRNQPT